MPVLTAVALSTLAIVAQDQVALRAAPKESAAPHAQLWQGDSLEVRGTKGDYLAVYDHRHERAGYVRASQVRLPSMQSEQAPELLAVVRFLRDTPNAEPLGLAYAAAFLKAAPAPSITPEVFDAVGTMAERLARRAAAPATPAAAQLVNAHLEVAAQYGVEMLRWEQDGQVRVCYNGDAFRRVMALGASAEQKARAALALTRHDCVPADMPPAQRLALDQWRWDVLSRADTQGLEPVLQNRLHMRRAGVLAALAHQNARRAGTADASVLQAGSQALQELAAVNKTELADADVRSYDEAAVRVGASLWAGALPAPAQSAKPTKLSVQLVAGEPGQTCVQVVDAQHSAQNPLASRCTYGTVWQASVAVHPQGKALAIAVQPTPTWRELWVFQPGAQGWRSDVLPPSAQGPGLGYVEFAGWVPGSAQMLSAREVVEDGRHQRRYELRDLDTLQVQRQADKPENLSTFYRWQAPQWKALSVSMR